MNAELRMKNIELKGDGCMNSKKIIGGGILAGVLFYAVSLLVWALMKFLPIVPLSIGIPSAALSSGWQVVHLAVSLGIGILWSIGYGIYGATRPSGWLYGATVYVVAVLPAFAINFMTAGPARDVIVYGAIVSFIAALLGGKLISLVVKR